MADLENNVPQDGDNLPNNEPQLTAAEQKAMEQGWVPQDQWEGDPEQWRPAKEFLDRGELFKKIEDQNRTIKEFKRALDDLKQHHSKTRETEYARALQALKAQKKTALEEGDADTVIKLDDQIDLVKEEQQKRIPCIVHVDGSCRIQTVTETQNQHYYRLIQAFEAQTGVPILFNTSFNLAGDPMVETIEDAVDTLRRSNLSTCTFLNLKPL